MNNTIRTADIRVSCVQVFEQAIAHTSRKTRNSTSIHSGAAEVDIFNRSKFGDAVSSSQVIGFHWRLRACLDFSTPPGLAAAGPE